MSERRATDSTTRTLLIAGIAIGPWFIVLSLVQALVRPGFDITKHEVSLLLAGSGGWAQTITFLITGLLALAFAVGLGRLLRPGKAGTWGPITVGAFGILFLIAGLNHPDPHLGFPIGAPEGLPLVQSIPSNIHSIAFSTLALAVVAFCFVFVRKFVADGDRGWAIGSAAFALGIIAFVATGSALMPSGQGGLPLLGAATAITGSLSAIAIRLLLGEKSGATDPSLRL